MGGLQSLEWYVSFSKCKELGKKRRERENQSSERQNRLMRTESIRKESDHAFAQGSVPVTRVLSHAGIVLMLLESGWAALTQESLSLD